MTRVIGVVLLGVVVVSCGNPPPPPEPPPVVEAPANCAGTGGEWLDGEGCRCEWTKIYTVETGCACPADLPVWNEELKRCDPAPPPPEPPPPAEGAKPEDYIALARVQGILYGTSSKSPGLVANSQFLTWAGWRDPHYVLLKCGFACEDSWIGMDCDALGEFGTKGQALVEIAESNLIPRFPEVNRRCKDEPAFCDVTNIRKTVWEPHRIAVDDHIAEASKLRARAASCEKAVQAAGQSGFDSIRGWCEKMNAGKVPLAACPE